MARLGTLMFDVPILPNGLDRKVDADQQHHPERNHRDHHALLGLAVQNRPHDQRADRAHRHEDFHRQWSLKDEIHLSTSDVDSTDELSMGKLGRLGLSQEAGGGGLRDELAGVEDLQGHGLVVLREVDNDRPQLLGMVDGPLGHLDEQHVNLGIILHV